MSKRFRINIPETQYFRHSPFSWGSSREFAQTLEATVKTGDTTKWFGMETELIFFDSLIFEEGSLKHTSLAEKTHNRSVNVVANSVHRQWLRSATCVAFLAWYLPTGHYMENIFLYVGEPRRSSSVLSVDTVYLPTIAGFEHTSNRVKSARGIGAETQLPPHIDGRSMPVDLFRDGTTLVTDHWGLMAANDLGVAFDSFTVPDGVWRKQRVVSLSRENGDTILTDLNTKRVLRLSNIKNYHHKIAVNPIVVYEEEKDQEKTKKEFAESLMEICNYLAVETKSG